MYETSTKCVRNIALYNPHDLNNVHHLEHKTRKLTLVMHRQHSVATMNLVANMLLLAHITSGEYLVCYSYHFVIRK